MESHFFNEVEVGLKPLRLASYSHPDDPLEGFWTHLAESWRDFGNFPADDIP
jgi:hypothetical protein